MIQKSNINLRSRKSRITLASLSITQERTASENTGRQPIVPEASKKTLVGLPFLLRQKYISFDDYMAACKYVELSAVIKKVMGCPNGFGRRVPWHQPFETSRVSWIQSELSLINQDYYRCCNDEELLTLWKTLQKGLNKMPLSFRTKLNELLFSESLLDFHLKERIYLKAFQCGIPMIKAFLVEFWKQKGSQ